MATGQRLPPATQAFVLLFLLFVRFSLMVAHESYQIARFYLQRLPSPLHGRDSAGRTQFCAQRLPTLTAAEGTSDTTFFKCCGTNYGLQQRPMGVAGLADGMAGPARRACEAARQWGFDGPVH